MDGDPFARMIEVIRGETQAEPVRMRRGTVVTRAPLSVEVAGLRQGREALRLDRRLKEAVEQELRAGEARMLLPGSRVILLTEDDQTFYLLCEVVDA